MKNKYFIYPILSLALAVFCATAAQAAIDYNSPSETDINGDGYIDMLDLSIVVQRQL